MDKQKQEKWMLARGTWISTRPVLPGVWQRKEGGHVVRARVQDPRTMRQKHVWKVLPDADVRTAMLWLDDTRARIRQGVPLAERESVPFATYAVSLLEKKLAAGDIKSAAGRRKWGDILRRLIEDPLGELVMDRIRASDLEAWRHRMAKKIASAEYRPATINTWLSVLKVVFAQAKRDFDLDRNPAETLRAFDTSTHHSYTDEEPNALTADELGRFLARMRETHPQHYAMTYLGFATGLRPSSMRPLRRKGPTPDVLWDDHVLLVRQSQTLGDEIMPCTKTGTTQRLTLPEELFDVLRWHVATQLRVEPMRQSDLLFPSELGGFRARSVLDRPFAEVVRAIGLTKRITPRGMRRSFQDLARLAQVADVVTRSISGHATETMQRHYSTVSPKEQADGLARLLELVRPADGERGGRIGGRVPPEGAGSNTNRA